MVFFIIEKIISKNVFSYRGQAVLVFLEIVKSLDFEVPQFPGIRGYFSSMNKHPP